MHYSGKLSVFQLVPVTSAPALMLPAQPSRGMQLGSELISALVREEYALALRPAALPHLRWTEVACLWHRFVVAQTAAV